MRYYDYFVNPIHFIFNFSIIKFIQFIYLNLKFNNLLNLFYFHIHLFFMYDLNFIIINLQYYLYFINPVLFVFFIINNHVLILSVIFVRYYHYFVNPINLTFNFSII